MSKLAETTVRILEGNVLLFKRPRSTYWQAKYVIGSRVCRISTKTDNYEKAVAIATDSYGKARWGAELGIPVVSRSFKSVAKLAEKQMQDELDAGRGKTTFTHYIIAINKYLIPYFGEKSITRIDAEAMRDYAIWRRDQLGKNPSRTLINTHNVTMTRIFNLALMKKFINQTQIPKMVNDGEKTKSRPDFTMADYVKLYTFMRGWVKRGKAGKITEIREITRDYVFFLSHTGARPGTETKGLKWSHFRFQVKNGVKYITVLVDGKTGPHEMVLRHSAVRELQRLIQRQAKYKDWTYQKAIEEQLDEYVFATSDGKEAKRLLRPFEQLLEEAGLLYDPRTKMNRTFYSLRHFWITQALLSGMSAAEVAAQCDTSVAMIDATYYHANPMMSAEKMAGKVIAGKRPKIA